jgi:hypothetical protein
MKYSVEINAGAMIYVLSFTKFGSAVQKLMAEGYTETRRAWRLYKPVLIFQKKENMLKKKKE